MKIDKKNWKKVKFEDVVTYKKVTVDPETSGLDRYIAGDHMTTEDLHLRRWGTVGDGYLGPAFHSKFEKGDILYGSRRTYLKKVAVADFDGITSNTTFVLKENTDLVIPGLIPFLMLSDSFTEHSVKNSKGSVNPYINFKDIGKYEFLLPPKDQQVKLAELLWAGDDVVEKYTKLEKNLTICTSNFIDNELFYSKAKKEFHKKQKLIDYCISKPKYGANAPSKPYVENSPRYIRITDINDDGRLISDGVVSIDSEDYNEYLLKEGDFLFARTGNTVGKTFLFRNTDGESVYAGYLIKFSLDSNKLKPEILELFCKSTSYQRFLKSVVKVGAQPNINAEQYSNLEVPLLTIIEQNKILEQYSFFNNSLITIRKNLNTQKQIQKQLINQIFA